MNELAVYKETQTTALVAMIEKVALTPEADLAKLEKLIDMQERVLNREAEMAYASAMSRVQAETPQVVKNAENTQTRSRYATLDAVCKALIPVASRNGFALSFGTEDAQREEERRITCRVSHEGGHCKEYHVDLPVDATGIGGKVNKTPIHAVKSAITYGRNILTTLIFNVALTDEDDDGNDAYASTITDKQAEEIDHLLTRSKADRIAFFGWIRANDVYEIPAKKYQQAVTMLRRKLSSSSTRPDSTAPGNQGSEASADPGEEDGGEAPSSSSDARKITAAQHKRLEARIKEAGADRAQLKRYFELEHLTDMTRDQYEACDQMLDKRQAKPKATKPPVHTSAQAELADSPTVAGTIAKFELGEIEEALGDWMELEKTGALTEEEKATLADAHTAAQDRLTAKGGAA